MAAARGTVSTPVSPMTDDDEPTPEEDIEAVTDTSLEAGETALPIEEVDFEVESDVDEFSGDTESFSGRFEVKDDDEIADEIEEALESSGEDMPGLSDGLHPELVKELQSLVSGTPTRHRASIKASDPEPHVGVSESASPRTPTYETYDVEVDHEKANTLLKHIYSELNEAYNEYGQIDTLVLGLPQYHVLEPWAQAEKHCSIEDVLRQDIVLVPGPMIHPVVDNRRLYHEYLREQRGND